MIKGIFWDNDGVLVDTESLYFQATAEVLSEIGIAVTSKIFIDISLRQGQSVLNLAREQGYSPMQIEALRRKRNERYGSLLQEKSTLLEGVQEALSQLYGQTTMAVVTGSRKDHFDLIHQSTGLLKYFDFVLTREDYTQAKPHPEPYLTALAKSGLRPEECVAVEDSERGMHSAIRAGLRCLAIPNKLTCDSDFSAATHILGNITEVPRILT